MDSEVGARLPCLVGAYVITLRKGAGCPGVRLILRSAQAQYTLSF
jgi:hypothetical protein